MVKALKYLLPLLILSFIPGTSLAQQTNTATTAATPDSATPASTTERWKKVSLTPEERVALAKAIATHVRSGTLSQDQAANLLALALTLDPTCKDGIVANFQLSHGKLVPVTPTTSPDELVKIIDPIADKLKNASDQDSKILSNHLFFAATAINPSDETAIIAFEDLSSKKIPLDWNSFYTERSYRFTPPATTAVISTPVSTNTVANAASTPAINPKTPAKKSQTKMKGLYVIELGQGKMVGGAHDVIATQGIENGITDNTDIDPTARDNEDHPPKTNNTTNATSNPPSAPNFKDAHFSNNKIGWQMRKSLKECYINLMASHPTWSLHDVVVSFEDNHSPQDGPSASTVFCLLMTSLQEGIELDPKVAITGDMSADLNVRPIGGVRSKIMGATAAECAYVGIPIKNSDELLDALILLTPDDSLITKIQVIGLTTYDEALTLARTDRPAEFQDTLNEFSALSPTLVPNGRLTPEQISKLEDILKKIPNHLSAKFLLDRQKNGWPKTISLRTSVGAISDFMDPFNERIQSKDEVTNLKFSQEFYLDLTKRFDAMKPFFHKDAQTLANHFENFMRDWRSASYKIENDRAGTGTIKSTITEVNKDYSSLKSDIEKILNNESNAAKLLN